MEFHRISSEARRRYRSKFGSSSEDEDDTKDSKNRFQVCSIPKRARTIVTLPTRPGGGLLSIAQRMDDLEFGILAKDERLRIIYMNRTAEQFYGKHEVVRHYYGKKTGEIWNDLSYYDEEIGDRLHSGITYSFQRIDRMEFTSGQIRYFRFDEVPLESSTGKVTGVVYITKDVTPEVDSAIQQMNDIASRRLLVGQITHQVYQQAVALPCACQQLQSCEKSENEPPSQAASTFSNAAEAIQSLQDSILHSKSLIQLLESDIQFDVYLLLLEAIASCLEKAVAKSYRSRVVISVEPIMTGYGSFTGDPIYIRTLTNALIHHAYMTAPSTKSTYVIVSARPTASHLTISVKARRQINEKDDEAIEALQKKMKRLLCDDKSTQLLVVKNPGELTTKLIFPKKSWCE